MCDVSVVDTDASDEQWSLGNIPVEVCAILNLIVFSQNHSNSKQLIYNLLSLLYLQFHGECRLFLLLYYVYCCRLQNNIYYAWVSCIVFVLHVLSTSSTSMCSP
jgi:hypothetical protein